MALVKAMHTAAICKRLNAKDGCVWTNLGKSARKKNAIAQLDTPLRAIFPSPSLDIERRT